MRSEGTTGAAIPDTRGVPLPTGPRGGVHVLDRPRPATAQSGWFRRPEPGEFTPEQLARAGYRAAGTGAAPRKKAGSQKATPKPAKDARPTPAASGSSFQVFARNASRGPSRPEKERIVAAYKDGATISAIHRDTGRAPTTVRRVLREAGVTTDPKRRAHHLTTAQIDQAVQLRQQGLTIAAVAAQVGAPTPTITRALDERGIAGVRVRASRFDHAAAVADYLAGAASIEVGAKYGVSSTSVLSAVRAAGHEPRRDHGGRPTGVQQDEQDRIVTAYVTDQHSIPTIAKDTGRTTATVRRVLRRAGVQLRDDRATGSGGANRLDEQTRAAAVTLYAQFGNAATVARVLHLGHSTVLRFLHQAGVEVVDAGEVNTGRPGTDGAAALKDLMRSNGVEASQVRAWAATTGRDCPTRGMPPRALVEDYLLATTPTRRSTTS